MTYDLPAELTKEDGVPHDGYSVVRLGIAMLIVSRRPAAETLRDGAPLLQWNIRLT